MRPELGEVLAKWDDAQDTRRWVMHTAKLDSLYACASTSIDIEAGHYRNGVYDVDLTDAFVRTISITLFMQISQ
jgi:hypothetical protein